MRKFMKLIKRPIFILFIMIFFLTSCQNSPQNDPGIDQNETPDSVYPSPITTDNADMGYPVEKQEPTHQNDYPAPIITETTAPSNYMELYLITEFTLDQPARVKWCSDQNCISVIGYDYFKVFSYPNYLELFSFTIGENEFLLDISPDGRTYALTNNNEDIILRNWETSSEKVIPTNTFFMGGEFSPDGSKIMITSMEEWSAPIFDVKSGSQLSRLTGFETAAPIYNVRFGQSNDYVAWIARATVQISEISTNQLFPAIFHQDFIMGFDINAEGSLLSTSAAEFSNDEFLPAVYIYDIFTGEIRHKFYTEKAVYGLSFAPDSSKLAISLGSSISFYDLETEQFTNYYISENDAISQILISPNEKILMCADEGLNLKFFIIK